MDFEFLGIDDFSFIVDEASLDMTDNEKAEMETNAFKLEVTFKNEMDMRDLFDDLTSKGYQVVIRGSIK
ncbi:MAG: hypothetical protein KDD61_02945, partial [Bdellovibrionales bacterium]|nr:hypothetical protein [Bdellovibrionales bacterium]